MADQNAAAKETAEAPAASKGQKPTLFIILAIVNMLIVAGVGGMLYMAKKKDAGEPKIEHVIKGELEAQKGEAAQDIPIIGKMVPLETFIVNLAGSRGRKIAKVNMELEIDTERVKEEIEARKAQVRDIIIIILSSKTFDEISSKGGKDSLREEIRDTVNAFLTKGKIKNVYFTELIYN